MGDCSPVFHRQSFSRLPSNLIANYNHGYLFINQSIISWPACFISNHQLRCPSCPSQPLCWPLGLGWAANSENLLPLNSRTVQLTMHAQQMELKVERNLAGNLPSGRLGQKMPLAREMRWALRTSKFREDVVCCECIYFFCHLP